ncbi:uncharacterized protein BX663DRAFT_35946 [Cokeromyces recurvatus]|uniref:uncharacterized protein n=1 Tax=Cokeromyces recurvatus TaxID=90255 RepID=UPI00221E5246|nr:uncharacterized protein BX663DRAFT_35946 [Cokeromyces recurvatus]KAI7903607.1 hypothetical protein BX663DRAFT_35946 [Cokeromyces recurvatus]
MHPYDHAKEILLNELADTLLKDIKTLITTPCINTFFKNLKSNLNTKTKNHLPLTNFNELSVYTPQNLHHRSSELAALQHKRGSTLSSTVNKENDMCHSSTTFYSGTQRIEEDARNNGKFPLKSKLDNESDDYHSMFKKRTKTMVATKERKAVLLYPLKKKSVNTNRKRPCMMTKPDDKLNSTRMIDCNETPILEKILQDIDDKPTEEEEEEEKSLLLLTELNKECDPFYQAKDVEDLIYLQIAITEKLDPNSTKAIHDGIYIYIHTYMILLVTHIIV